MSTNQTQTMTIANVSMSPKEETARIIRATCKKYDIAISQLMNAMISAELGRIEEFAQAIVKERKEKALEIERQMREAKASQSGGYALNSETQKLKSRLEHDAKVTEARFANMNAMMDNIEKNIDIMRQQFGTLMEALGEKPLFEPIDSSEWGRENNSEPQLHGAE